MEPASAYEKLRTEILRGGLQPGQRLRVAELNGKFQLGLTPIREALMRLSSEGLVVTEANRGARVRETSVAELRDLTDTRQKIEAWCLERAMENGTKVWEADVLRHLYLLNHADLPTGPEDREREAEWERLHRAFHFALVQPCGSDWSLHIWNMLADHSERYRNLRLLSFRTSRSRVEKMINEHETIAQAVIRRDVETALSLMSAHLQNTATAVEELLSTHTE
ncbi:GntR family transcriptional regulator [Mesobacterium pallidum]|uniref:GntR family transcriptional regulator n=1 Tax=Mesobacterium pallidum TaxID=2872037 RepID=UPI001EE174DD|nr:GntR family transcriptional regulator [Mesobacterium pallidum]